MAQSNRLVRPTAACSAMAVSRPDRLPTCSRGVVATAAARVGEVDSRIDVRSGVSRVAGSERADGALCEVASGPLERPASVPAGRAGSRIRRGRGPAALRSRKQRWS